ncbi:hypothetical protein [Cerasicoccus maritimus]|uniref:hypothetical protein n=1 Tax=Cerasicoccus maritimus TaxID=490089 RepID=UPI0028525B96|nr:hypothetical protein [Cerasicoccus maritimus]
MDPLTTAKSHRFFAVEAFNECWELMHLPERNSDEERMMLRLAETSFWHWQHAAGRKATNDAVGYWLLSRVYALVDDAATALDYAEKGIEVVKGHKLNAFYVGYAWEAASRAYFLAGKTNQAEQALAKAKREVAKISDPANKAALEMDLLNVRPVMETSGSAIA